MRESEHAGRPRRGAPRHGPLVGAVVAFAAGGLGRHRRRGISGRDARVAALAEGKEARVLAVRKAAAIAAPLRLAAGGGEQEENA
jgi:hypothetical protein